ncbi:vesicle-associated protein 1-4 [Trifolium repens]|nr:vesicle-associated protein 1-4 [Trifolium repens]
MVLLQVNTTNPKKYNIMPNIGDVKPRSSCDIKVIMQAQEVAPPNLQCKDLFVIQTIFERPGATTKDITPKMFEKNSGYKVIELTMQVVYVAPPKLPSPVQEIFDKESAPQASLTSYKVTVTDPKKYCVKPIGVVLPKPIGVVLPRSTCDIIVTMQAQKEAPLDMQCKDKFLIQSTVLSKKGATIKDVVPKMFNKDYGYDVKEYKLKVVYVAPPQPPSSVREGSDKDTSFQIHPRGELQFPFELRKQISCSMQLSNKSDNNVAFKVLTTNPKKYCVRPNNGVVLPWSTCDIIVTMQAQKEAPIGMQCKDKFLIQSIVANHKSYHSKNGSTTKDITPEMFKKESGYEVQECKLKVAYVAPRQPPVQEGSDKDLSPNRVQFSHLSNSSTNASTTSSNFWQEKCTNLEAAFKTYIMMKEGRIPDQVADILGLSNHGKTETKSGKLKKIASSQIASSQNRDAVSSQIDLESQLASSQNRDIDLRIVIRSQSLLRSFALSFSLKIYRYCCYFRVSKPSRILHVFDLI